MCLLSDRFAMDVYGVFSAGTVECTPCATGYYADEQGACPNTTPVDDSVLHNLIYCPHPQPHPSPGREMHLEDYKKTVMCSEPFANKKPCLLGCCAGSLECTPCAAGYFTADEGEEFPSSLLLNRL